MRSHHREPSLDDVLSDPIVVQLMVSDRVSLVDLRSRLESLRQALSERASRSAQASEAGETSAAK